MTRLRVAILGLLFWLVFGLGTLVTLVGQFFGIFAYLFGLDTRGWVTKTGQGTDGLCNAAFFNGDPRETISSHTGRWFQYGQAISDSSYIPTKFRFVKWLTDLFEKDHCIKAIEAPFKDQPL